jgi:P4 family phage/plasmid primase-like protien
MTATIPLNVKPSPGESVQAVTATLVSCVKTARDTTTQHYDAREIIESIRTEKHFKLREPVEKIRQRFRSIMASTGSDRKAAKEAVAQAKKMLPGVLWSGRFRNRKRNDPDKLSQHSGLLCADLDELGDRIADVRAKLVTSPHLWALFLSPTGDGLKCVFRVAADAEKHKASFRAVEAHVRDLTSAQIDQACSDLSRLCFLSHDPDAHLNDKAVELPPLIETEKPAPSATAVMCEPEIESRQRIAVELLGTIDWRTEMRGCCTCPAQHLHTTGNGARDCEVRIDGAPTIHCFHNHCRGIREGVNHELRSRIGKAERAAKSQIQNGDTTAATVTPERWLNQKFPSLSGQFGDPILEGVTKQGVVYVQDIGEDFFAATLGDEGSPDAPTVFLPTEAKFYTYGPTDGIFVQQRDPVLLARLSRLLLECSRECPDYNTNALEFRFRDSANLSGVLKKARGLLEVSHDFFSTDLTEFIPCANGMLRLSDKALLPFSSKYGRRNKLAVPYDSDAKCPLFLDTLMRPALDPDDLDLLQRWCGLALVGENIAQSIVILTGTPGGGKGTFIRVLNGIIGSTNVASLRTQHLADRFEISRFLGKTLLYGPDVPENFLNQRGASVLKSLTGGDPMTLEFKQSNESPLINCKFNVIVTCNSRLTVHLEGDTDAWRRRLAIVDYHKPKPNQVIADLDHQILDAEASGVLNWMIEGLDKIRANGWQLILNSAQQRAVDNLLLESDGDNLFAREALIRAEGEQLIVEDCWCAYVEFCTQRGWKTLLRRDFASRIGDVVVRTHKLTVSHDIKDDRGKSQRGWNGLKLREGHQVGQ